MVRALLVALAVLSGCAAVEPPAYERQPLSFAHERIVWVPLARAATVTYAIAATDDITAFDSCLVHAGGLEAWRADRTQGISCDVDASGGDGEVELPPGEYALAMHCLEAYAEVCHVELTLSVS